jgi:hypothetical protein
MRYAVCYVLASGLLLYCASGSFAQGIFSGSNAKTDVVYAADFTLKDLNSKALPSYHLQDRKCHHSIWKSLLF